MIILQGRRPKNNLIDSVVIDWLGGGILKQGAVIICHRKGVIIMIQGPESKGPSPNFWGARKAENHCKLVHQPTRGRPWSASDREAGQAHALRHCEQATSDFVVIRWWLGPKAKESVVIPFLGTG